MEKWCDIFILQPSLQQNRDLFRVFKSWKWKHFFISRIKRSIRKTSQELIAMLIMLITPPDAIVTFPANHVAISTERSVTSRAQGPSDGDWWPRSANQRPCFTAKLLTPNSSTLVATSSFCLVLHRQENMDFLIDWSTQSEEVEIKRAAAFSVGISPRRRGYCIIPN